MPTTLLGHHIYNNRFQCSGNSSVCLTAFLLEAAAAAEKVETLFPKISIAGQTYKKRCISTKTNHAKRIFLACPTQQMIVSHPPVEELVKLPLLFFKTLFFYEKAAKQPRSPPTHDTFATTAPGVYRLADTSPKAV